MRNKIFLGLLLVMGCVVSAGEKLSDKQPITDPTVCRGPRDVGNTVFWVFYPARDVNVVTDTRIPELHGRFETRYVCKYHGRDRHGYWFEAVHEGDTVNDED